MTAGRLPVILVLGTTQTLAWGSSYYLPAIVAEPIGHDLGITASWVFAAFSLSLLISGLVGPAVGRRIDNVGGREVLAASNLILAAGLGLLSLAHDLATVLLAWIVIGFGMGLGLYDSAFATLGRLYGRDARSAITGIALMAGFASTIGWPLTAWGIEQIGWRATCAAWALAHVLIGAPLNWFGLPKPPSEPADVASLSQLAAADPIVFDRNMWLLAFAFAAIWFVAGAMAAHLPAILMASGSTHGEAVFAASLMGPAQVAARIVEAKVLMRFHPLVSARLASFAHPAAAVILTAAGPVASPLFGIIHGAGNGILTIARGTVPLAIYGPRGYGYRLGLLGAPARAAQALAPVSVSLILDNSARGALWVTGLVGVLTAVAFLLVRPELEPKP